MNDRRELRLRERIDVLVDERDEARERGEALNAELDAMREEVAALAKRCAKLERELDAARLKRDRLNSRYHEMVRGRDFWRGKSRRNTYHAQLYRDLEYARKRKAKARGVTFS